MIRQLLLFVVPCMLAVPGMAQEVVIDASRDNTLYENPMGLFSNGSGSKIFAGSTPSNGIRRALIAFDVAGSVPAGSVILSVELTLSMDRTIAGPEDITLHPVTTDWGEGASDASGEEGGGALAQPGDATWIHTFFDTDFWTTEGGDFDATASATQTVAGLGDYVWGSTPAMVADVQSWLDDPTGNHGWILIGNELGIATTKRFESRESGNGPELRIVYDGPEPQPLVIEVPTLSPLWLAALAALLAVAGAIIVRRS